MKKRLLAAWIFGVTFSHAVRADQIVKQNNGDNLNTTTAWVGGVVPGASDVGVWNSSLSGSTLTNAMGGSLAFQGLIVTGFTGKAAILSGTTTLGNLGASTLTMGSEGIQAWKIVNISSTVRLASAQAWIVGKDASIDVNDNKNNTGVPLETQGYDLTVDVKVFGANNNYVDVGDMFGSGNIIKDGPGQLLLRGGGSNFTGNITLNNGQITGSGVDHNFGTGQAELFINGGELWLASNLPRIYGRNMTVSANATIRNHNSSNNGPVRYTFAQLMIGASTLTVTSTCAAAGTVTGTITFASATLTGDPTFYVPIMGCRTDAAARDRNWLLIGSISESGGSRGLTKTGGGYLFITNASTYSGDTLVQEGYLTLNHTNAMAKSTLNMVSGDTGTLQWNATGTFTLGGLKGDRNLDLGGKTVAMGNNNGSTTYSGVLSNGSIQKTGTGTLTLSGNNTYSGTTEVNAGTLLVTGTHSGGGAYSVASGAVLGGGGTIGNALTVNGSIRPGVNSLDTLTVNGNVTWNGALSWSAATDWKFDLGAGNSSDLLEVEGNFTKAGNSAFRFDFGGSNEEGTFTLVQWTGSTTFSEDDFSYANLPEGTVAVFQIDEASSPRTLKAVIGSCESSPTITLGSGPVVCAGTTSAELSYSGTSGSPDKYIIDYSDTANEVAGFVDVLATDLPASPIPVSIQSYAPAGVYTGTLTVVDSATGCRSSTNFTVTVNTTPATPGGITQGSPSGSAVCKGANGVTYSIAAVAMATGYQWSVPSGATIISGQGTTAITVNWGTAASGNVTVNATNACGTSANQSLAVTVLTAAPGTPTAGEAMEVALTSFLANWSAGSGTIAGYRLDVATSLDFVSGFVVSNVAVSGTSYALSGLESGVTYYYRVRAYNACGTSSDSETITVLTPLILAGWDVSGLTGGSGNYGSSPLEVSTYSTGNVGVIGLSRGPGVGQSGSAAARGWGGTGWNSASAGDAIAAGQFVTSVVQATSGRLVSFTSISKFDYRRPADGPTSGLLQYSIDGSTYHDITTLDYTSTDEAGGSIAVPISLTGISELQGVTADTPVTFRVVNYGASSGTAPWYVYDKDGSTADDIEIRGVICETPVAYGVSGGGAYCAGGSGVVVGLSNSQLRVSYQLYRNNGGSPVAVGVPRGGTGGAISFGLQTVADTYTVEATRNSGGCAATMAGSVTVTVTALPPAPVNPQVTATNNGEVSLSWEAPEGSVTGYNVKRSKTQGGSYTTVAGGTNVAGLVFTDTSAINGNTYYYIITAINNGCEGSGSDEVTAVMPAECPTGYRPTMARPANQTVTVGNTLNLSVTVQDSSTTCLSPVMSQSLLPSGMTTNDTTGGGWRTRQFTWAPTGTQTGVYPITVTAVDEESFSTSVTFIVFVGGPSEPGNPPVSLTNWSVAISSVTLAGTDATITWPATEGVSYDVYTSTKAVGDSPVWTKVVAGHEATSATEEAVVAGDGAMRFYQVVPEGTARTDRGMWGIVRPTIPSGMHLMAPPLVSDRSFADDGQLGQALAAVVPVGTQVHIATSGDPEWLTLEKKSNGTWRTDPGLAEHTTPLNAGQAFFVQGANGVTPLFSGMVGNAGAQSLAITTGYNLVGVSEGKGLAPAVAFSATTMEPDPVGENNQNNSDQIVIQHLDGSWRRLVRSLSGTWIDMKTGGATSVTLKPGEAYYYIRKNSSTTVSF